MNPPRLIQPKFSPNANRRLQINDPYARSPTTSIDTRLSDWLVKQNIDTISRNIILGELFTYEDFVFELEKTDLHRIGLKCGVEVKLWRALKNHRKQFSNIADDLGVSQINHNEDINRNITQQCPIITYEPASPSHRSATGSNYNSYDSSSNPTSDDYESCNGGDCDDTLISFRT